MTSAAMWPETNQRIRTWVRFNSQVVRLLSLVGRHFPGSRSRTLILGLTLISDSWEGLASEVLDPVTDPTVTMGICRHFAREIQQVRREFDFTPQVMWFERLLVLGCRMDQALRAIEEARLPVEVKVEIGVAGAIEEWRINQKAVRTAVSWWIARNPEAVEADEPTHDGQGDRPGSPNA